MSKTAIVLAAGMGNRLLEHTTHKPKALVEVNDRPLISYALEYVKIMGAEKICVVGGYHYKDVEKTVRGIEPNAIIEENPEYTLQNLVSFNTLIPHIEDNADIIVVNIDYVFKKETVLAMKEKCTVPSVFCSYDLSGDDEDVMKVKVDEQKNVIAMSKTLDTFDAIYNGYWYIDAAHIPLLKTITAELMKSADLKTTTVEEIFHEFVKRGETLHAADIGHPDWLEVDTPEELEYARSVVEKYIET